MEIHWETWDYYRTKYTEAGLENPVDRVRYLLFYKVKPKKRTTSVYRCEAIKGIDFQSKIGKLHKTYFTDRFDYFYLRMV